MNKNTANSTFDLWLVRYLPLTIWYFIGLIILLISIWVFVARVVDIYGFTLDDSFITYRYGKHLADGDGLVWNLGEIPPIEGYTTFLWVLVAAFFELINVNTEQFCKYLSLLATFFILPLLLFTPFSLANRLTNNQDIKKADTLTNKKIFLVACFLSGYFLVSPDLPAHAVSGMETLFAALILLLIALAFTFFDIWSRKKRIIIPAILSLAGGLIRPEFNVGIFLGYLVLYGIWRIWYRDQKVAKDVLYSLAIYFICGLIFFLWRYQYFGLTFPLPFYIKQLEPNQLLFKGLQAMSKFNSSHWPFIVIAIVGVVSHPKRLLAPAIMAFTIYGYFYFPSHVMGIYNRFAIPILPVFLWLSASAFHRALTSNFIPAVVWIIGFCALTFGFINGENIKAHGTKPQAISQFPYFNGIWRFNYAWLNDYNQSEHRSLIPLGKALAKDLATNPQRLKIAMVDLGAVAYYGDWQMIDLFGLTHPKLALARSRGEYNADMLLQEQPDIILLGEFFREKSYRGQFPFELELFNKMKSYNYRAIARFKWNHIFGFLVFTKDRNVSARFINILQGSPKILSSLEIVNY